MSRIRSAPIKAILAAACLLGALSIGAVAQDAPSSPPSELGSESANWGLAPFVPIMTLSLSAENKKKVRDLEDTQLQERRVLEDRYEAELRAMLIRQADVREALRKLLLGP
jgi:Spy/CpxP family protein refolding chaperone